MENFEEEDLRSRLANLREDRNSVEREIKELRNKLAHEENTDSDNFEEIQNSLEKRTVELRRLENEIQDIKNRLGSSEDTNFREIRDDIGSIRNEVQEVKDVISSEGLDDKVERIDQIKNEAEEVKNENQEIKEKLSHVLSKEISDDLGSYFRDRRDDLRKPMYAWGILSLASIGSLMWASWRIYLDIASGSAQEVALLSKIALLIPVSVAVWFTTSNYSRERKLLEEYAFKSTLSFSLDGYRKVLQDELPEGEEDQLVDFLTTSMLRIYSNPQDNLGDEEKNTPVNGSVDQIIQQLRKLSPEK